MRNIHIIPTDKPSRLGYLTKKGKQVFNDLRLFDRVMPNILDSENQHLYITNSEEIKQGDWIFNEEREPSVLQCIGKGSLRGWNKIILTTDQSLIQDGIEAIDDEFLEWFVKNPSCDEVETYSLGIKNEETGESCHYEYEIIIPKEEPKQLNSEDFGLPKFGTKEYNDLASGLFGGKPKQEKLTYIESAKKEERISNSIMMKRKQETVEETVEEAAENNWDKINSQYKNGVNPYAHKIGFIEGAKWQQEQMYSEEDMRKAFIAGGNSQIEEDDDYGTEYDAYMQDWFEQFKKK